MRRRKTRLAAAGLVLAAALSGCGFGRAPGSSAPARPAGGTAASERAEAPRDVVLDFAGDCALSDINDGGDPRNFPAVYRRSGSPTYPFDRVKAFFASDGLTVVNFECALTAAAAEGEKQWHFRGLPSYAAILPASSVEVAVLSNNHCPLDYLAQGYRDTVRNLRESGVGLAEQSRPFVASVDGVEVVIIGDCSVTGEDTTVTAGVAERVTGQIRRYKKPGNVVAVDMHWGSEYKDVQPWQKTAARQFVDAGADVVVGQHPHRLNGVERYKGRYIVYSLGNFAFGGNRSCPFPETLVFRVRFRWENGVVSMREAGVLPCFATSSGEKNGAGHLLNDFQPVPVTGEKARRVMDVLLSRSKNLPDGIKTIRQYAAESGR